jgi:hypothetical protein
MKMDQISLQIYFAMQKRLFPQIDKETFEALISSGKVLETDEHGVKVLETDDQDIIKIFRLKRVFSSAFLFPYAWRFKNNARLLRKKGIETVNVKKVEYCLSEQRHLVTYDKIAGQTIRELLTKKGKDEDLIKKLIAFVARLHAKGIYFRSLHFGNVVVTNKGEMALIDIADLSVYPCSLINYLRIRNWERLLKYSFEKSYVIDFGEEQFFDRYADDAFLSLAQREKLKKALIE